MSGCFVRVFVLLLLQLRHGARVSRRTLQTRRKHDVIGSIVSINGIVGIIHVNRYFAMRLSWMLLRFARGFLMMDAYSRGYV